MGYTHYWYRDKEISPEDYIPIVDGFQKLLSPLKEFGVKLGNGSGEGEPVVNCEEVTFNGLVNCGHPANSNIIIPWPSAKAAGIGDSATAICGEWFAGAKLQTRCCDGDCSYETFSFPRVIEPAEWQKPVEKVAYYKEGGKPVYHKPDVVGKWFEFCKTAFRPYDIAVTAFLVMAKHYLPGTLKVHSDGDLPLWRDGMWLCQIELGYGVDFKLDD